MEEIGITLHRSGNHDSLSRALQGVICGRGKKILGRKERRALGWTQQ